MVADFEIRVCFGFRDSDFEICYSHTMSAFLSKHWFLILLTLGLALSIPMLRRLYRRFHTWVAPALAIAAFAVMFALSALVIAPLITGGPARPAQPGVQLPAGHASHHAG